MWEGERIVSKAWLDTCLREHARWEERNLSYGYLWWVVDADEGIFAAMGDGGNVVYCNRRKNLVVAIASLFKPCVPDRIAFIRSCIEPHFDA